MSSARSKRLAGPVEVATGVSGQVIYTCPDGKVALVKSVRVANNSSGACVARLTIGASGASRLVLVKSVAAGDQFVDPDTDPIVLHAGEQLTASTATNVATFTLSGAELTA